MEDEIYHGINLDDLVNETGYANNDFFTSDGWQTTFTYSGVKACIKKAIDELMNQQPTIKSE